MTYQRLTRKHRHLKYMRAKKQRINTGLGHVFQVMRYLRLAWLARFIVRSPWHVADLYVDGQFVKALHIYPKESAAQRMDRINAEAQARIVKLTQNTDVMVIPSRPGRTNKRSTR